jgi:hypothetical protein
VAHKLQYGLLLPGEIEAERGAETQDNGIVGFDLYVDVREMELDRDEADRS